MPGPPLAISQLSRRLSYRQTKMFLTCSTAAPHHLNSASAPQSSQVNLDCKEKAQVQVGGGLNWPQAGCCSSITGVVTDLSRRTTAVKTYSCTHRYSTGIRTSLCRVQKWRSR